MIFGKIVIALIIMYALWCFITIGCLGGLQGYWQHRADCARIRAQMKHSQQDKPRQNSITFNKIFG